MFAGHCVIGVFGIGYFTYKTFLNRNESVYDKHTKSFRTKSPLFKNLCKTVFYIIIQIDSMVINIHDIIRVYTKLIEIDIVTVYIGKGALKDIFKHDKNRSIVSGLLYIPDDVIFWAIVINDNKDASIIVENKG